MKIETLHCVGDKAIYDALCQSTKVKNSDLQQLLLKRGIICSSNTDRKSLAAYFSSLTHDFDDYSTLCDLLGTSRNRDKITSTLIESKASSDKIRESLDRFERDAAVKDEDVHVKTRKRSHGIEVDITYQEFNPNKNEFSQYITKTASVLIEKVGADHNFRYPSNTKIESLVQRIFNFIGEDAGEDVKQHQVSLSSIEDPNIRNEFFSKLINKIDHFDLEDVTDVNVYHLEKELMGNSDPEDEEQCDEVQDVSPNTHITKASLKGVGVLESPELQGLYEKGFYLCRIVWFASRKNIPDSDRYIIEATMSDPKNFSGFTYMIKGKYKYHGGFSYAKNWKRLDAQEERLLSTYVEKAASEVSAELIKTYKEAEASVESVMTAAAEDSVVQPQVVQATASTTEQSDGTL